MKLKLFVIALIFSSTTVFAQRFTKEKETIQFTQLPMIPMPNVKTYGCKWDSTSIEENFPNYKNEVGINVKTIQGILDLQGYTYSESDPDVIITLVGKKVENVEPEIVNISYTKGSPNYRAKYSVPADWELRIEGKFSTTIKLEEFVDRVNIYFPSAINPLVISTEERMEGIVLEKEKTINSYVRKTAMTIMLDETKAVVHSKLCYRKKFENITVESFKSNKKHDMTAWEKPFEQGLELLSRIDKGENPYALYAEYKGLFDFWDAEFQEDKDNSKKRKVREVAATNLVNFLKLVNPALVKEEYFSLVDSKMKSLVEDAKKRQVANSQNAFDYTEFNDLPVLDDNSYLTNYFTSKGDSKKGVIKLSSHYGFDPSNTSLKFELYDLDTYLKMKDKLASKYKVDVKSVEAYELFGTRYEKLKYSDPTALSLSGNEAFLEVLIKGKLSLYKLHSFGAEESSGITGVKGLKSIVSFDMNSSEDSGSKSLLFNCRAYPNYIIKYKKKKTVVFNYSKLADILKDCKTVSDKIKAGEYGNDEIAEKKSKLGKFVQSGLHNEIKEELISKIVNEFNSLM